MLNFLPFIDVIYVSAAGSMLCQIVNSLLLLPVSVARPLLSYLLDLLPPLDCLNRLLPAAALLEDQWEFSRQRHWSGLPCPPPGDLDSEIKTMSPAVQETWVRSLGCRLS